MTALARSKIHTSPSNKKVATNTFCTVAVGYASSCSPAVCGLLPVSGWLRRPHLCVARPSACHNAPRQSHTHLVNRAGFTCRLEVALPGSSLLPMNVFVPTFVDGFPDAFDVALTNPLRPSAQLQRRWYQAPRQKREPQPRWSSASPPAGQVVLLHRGRGGNDRGPERSGATAGMQTNPAGGASLGRRPGRPRCEGMTPAVLRRGSRGGFLAHQGMCSGDAAAGYLSLSLSLPPPSIREAVLPPG